MKIIFLSCILLLSSPAFAILGYGTLAPSLSTQTDTSGGTETFQFNPYIYYGQKLPNYIWDFTIQPEIAGAYHLGELSGYKKISLFATLPILYSFNSESTLRYGIATIWSVLIGDGGTTTINGTSYAYPDKTLISYTTPLLLGYEHKLSSFSLRFDTLLFNWIRPADLRFGYTLSFNYEY